MPAVKEVSIQRGDEIDLSIESVSFGGEGIARLNDYVFFVKGAVAGDVVRARVSKIKKNFGEAQAIHILTPSPNRVEPPCSYFGTCGGCKWQNVDYTTQLEFKRINVKDVLQRIGGFESIDVPTPLASPKIFHYRNKMEFTFGDTPWLTDLSMKNLVHASFALGLHVPQRFDKVLDIDDCYLQSPLANEILNFVKSFAKSSGLETYSVKFHTGFWRFLVIRETAHTHQLMVNIITTGENEAMEQLKKSIVTEFPQINSLIHGISSGKSQVAVSEREIILHGNLTISEKLGEYEFEISSNSFFQTNTLAAEILYETVKKMAGLKQNDLIYDLYCGTGSIAIYLSASVKRIIGIELIENAVQDAAKNAERNRVTNCRFVHGDMRLALKQLNEKPDAVIVDPPRSGMHPEVVSTLLELAPERIIYVSCNPSTQARDLALLCKDNYSLEQVQPVDMFPHTFHIENVAKLVRH
jgi:23S rRNA (uracil1939-C5)-methyltransferase